MDLHLYSPSQSQRLLSKALNGWSYLVIEFLVGVRPIKFNWPENQEIIKIKPNLICVATNHKSYTYNYQNTFKSFDYNGSQISCYVSMSAANWLFTNRQKNLLLKYLIKICKYCFANIVRWQQKKSLKLTG